MIPSGAKAGLFFIAASSPVDDDRGDLSSFSMLSCRRMIATSPSLISGSIESPLTPEATNSPLRFCHVRWNFLPVPQISSDGRQRDSGTDCTDDRDSDSGRSLNRSAVDDVGFVSRYSGVTWNFSASVVAQRQSILFFPDSQNETALGEMNISAISFCVIRLLFEFL